MKVVRIGRAPDNEVVISDTSVSRNHLEIIKTDRGVFILKDLNSRNGTYVNGKKVNETTLQETDIIRIGNTTLPWLNYFKDVDDNDTMIDTEELSEIKSKKKKKGVFSFRNVLSIVMTIMSLLLMMFALLRYLK